MNKKVFAAIAVAILVIICAISAITLAHHAYTDASSSDASTENAESSDVDESAVSEPSDTSEVEESLADVSDTLKDPAPETSTPAEESDVSEPETSEAETSTAPDVSDPPSDESSEPSETSMVEEPSQPDEPSEPEDVSDSTHGGDVSVSEVSDTFDESTEPVSYCVITGRMSVVTYSNSKTYGVVYVKGDKYQVKNSKDGFELTVPVGEIVTLVFSPDADYGVFSLFVNEERIFADNLNEYTLVCDSNSIQVRAMLKEVGEKAEQFAGPTKIVLNGETHFVASYDEAKELLSLDDLEAAEMGYVIIIYKNGIVATFTSIGNGTYDVSWGGTKTAQQIYNLYIGSWCSDCGKRSGHGANGTCVKYLSDLICSRCGEYCKLLECHTCDE